MYAAANDGPAPRKWPAPRGPPDTMPAPGAARSTPEVSRAWSGRAPDGTMSTTEITPGSEAGQYCRAGTGSAVAAGGSGVAAATTTTPARRASRTAEVSSALRFGSATDTVITSAFASTAARSASATRAASGLPSASVPRRPSTRARGATPLRPGVPPLAPATRFATNVPCPTQSSPPSPREVTRPLSAAADEATPVSTTATVTPSP